MFEQKAAETEPAPGYNEYIENIGNTQDEAKFANNNNNEEENNEIDLTHTTESPTSDISETYNKFTRDPREPEDNFSVISTSNRLRSTKILDENNSGRNMPAETRADFSFPWALLEKPVMKKNSQN